MTETSADLPIQPELIADGQSLAKELNISWAQLVYLPAPNTCSAVSFKSEKVGEVMV